jgi:hypothetical protein
LRRSAHKDEPDPLSHGANRDGRRGSRYARLPEADALRAAADGLDVAATPPTASLRTILAGFEQAFARFMDARLGNDPDPAFFALFETLNWLSAVDQRLGLELSATPGRRDDDWCDAFLRGRMLRAVRFARNSVHHQWADALQLDTSGAAWPVHWPMASFEWRWRNRLPGSRDRAGAQLYAEQLAGQPARLTLTELHRLVFRAYGKVSPR